MIILEFPKIKDAASFRVSKRMHRGGKFEEWETVESLRELISEHVDSTFKV